MTCMIRRIFLVLSLALLFGFGQQGAAVHAVSHLADWQLKQQQPDKGQHETPCDKCVVYAELGSAVGTQAVALPSLENSYQQHAQYQLRAGHASGHSYSARAPPFLA